MKNIFFPTLTIIFIAFSLIGCEEKINAQAVEKPTNHVQFISATGWDTTLYVNGEPVTRSGYFNSNGMLEITPWLQPGANTIRMAAKRLDSKCEELDVGLFKTPVESDAESTRLGGIAMEKIKADAYDHSFEIQNEGKLSPLLWAKGEAIGVLTDQDRAAMTKLVNQAADALRQKNLDAYKKVVTPSWGKGPPPAWLLPEGMSWPEMEKMERAWVEGLFTSADYKVKMAPPASWEWAVGKKVVMLSLAPPKEYPKDANKDYGLEILKGGPARGGSIGIGTSPHFIKMDGKWILLSR